MWSASLAFFQLVLLLGYSYAHLLGLANRKVAMGIHAALSLAAAILCLKIYPSESLQTGLKIEQPSAVFYALSMTIGLPFFLLSTTSPLLQKWMSVENSSSNPYRLFALSNLASLAALLAFPFLIEPYVSTRFQIAAWSVLFLGYVVSMIGCAIGNYWAVKDSETKPKGNQEHEKRTDFQAEENLFGRLMRSILWVALSASPSILLLATNNQMSSSGPAVPFMWILPLATYLLTFVICFDNDRWYSQKIGILLAVVSAILATVLLLRGPLFGLSTQLAGYCIVLFGMSYFCHGELAMLRPHSTKLTRYYLCIASGGSLGSLFVTFVAPNIFNDFWEYPVGLFACLAAALGGILCLNAKELMRTTVGRNVLIPTSILFVLGFGWIHWSLIISSHDKNILRKERDFHGVVTSVENIDQGKRHMLHNKVVHGIEKIGDKAPLEHLGYSHAKSGLGIAFDYLGKRNLDSTVDKKPTGLSIACVGLGTGSILSWAKPSYRYRFFEISPAVISSAENEFHFLSDTPAKVEVTLQDGRIGLDSSDSQNGSPYTYDVIILDAFSGDSVPIHLMTLEAMELYLSLIPPDGLILFQITNRHLDMAPVIENVANELDVHSKLFEFGPIDITSKIQIQKVRWMIVSPTSSFFETPEVAEQISPIQSNSEVLWTDDFSSLIQVWK